MDARTIGAQMRWKLVKHVWHDGSTPPLYELTFDGDTQHTAPTREDIAAFAKEHGYHCPSYCYTSDHYDE